MKQISKLAFGLFTLIATTLGADSQMEMPSSVPFNVFQVQKDQIGVGYIQFTAKLELEDEYYGDKIGDVDYNSKGLIITLPEDKDTIIGKMFELSFTVGKIDSKLNNNRFVDNGKTYNNSYKKDGFYIGVRPAYSLNIYESSDFIVQNSTSLHMMLYSIDGSFSVRPNSGLSYAYNETNTGVGLKPTTVINGTYFPIDNLGLTLFGGFSTFAALDFCAYSSVNGYEEEDVELAFQMASISPIYGFDVIFKGIFAKNDSFNLSSVFAVKNVDTSVETIVRYVFTF